MRALTITAACLTLLVASTAAADLKCEHTKSKTNGAAVRYLGATPGVKSKVRRSSFSVSSVGVGG